MAYAFVVMASDWDAGYAGVCGAKLFCITSCWTLANSPWKKLEKINASTELNSFENLAELEKPLIVHSHTPKAGIIGMLATKLAGVPHRLHTVAGLPLMEATGKRRKLLDFVERLTYRCATKVYPNSKGLSDFILKNNLLFC